MRLTGLSDQALTRLQSKTKQDAFSFGAASFSRAIQMAGRIQLLEGAGLWYPFSCWVSSGAILSS